MSSQLTVMEIYRKALHLFTETYSYYKITDTLTQKYVYIYAYRWQKKALPLLSSQRTQPNASSATSVREAYH